MTRAGLRTGIGLMLGLVLTWAVPAAGQDTLRAALDAGSVGNRFTVAVKNGGGGPVEGLTLGVVGAPRLLTNIRISPEVIASLAPGASQEFTVRFDVSPDAPRGSKETVAFALTGRKAARIQPSRPALAVTIERGATPVFTLVSIEGNADKQPPAALSAAGERVAGEWVPWSFANAPSGSKLAWALQSVFRVPSTIKLGEDFTIGLCGAAAFGVAEGQPKRLGLEHLTEVNVIRGGGDPRGASVAASVQAVAFPDHAGKETGASQEAQLLFKFNAAKSRLPDAFAYDAVKVKAQGRPSDRSGLPGGLGGRQPSSTLQILVGKTADRDGLLGTSEAGQDTHGKFAYIEVALREELTYGLSRYDLGSSFSRWWLLRYRPLKPGEAAPSFGPPAHARGDECPAVVLGLTTVASAGAGPSAGGTTGGAGAEATPPPGEGLGGGRSAGGATGDAVGGVSTTPRSSGDPAGGTNVARVTPDVGEPAGTGRPGGRVPRDPAALDPRSPDVSRLIREWLQVAEPLDNAQGARLRYDEWGRVHGSGVHGERITPGRPPDTAAGKTPAEFAWTLRDSLDSVAHCTLGEYVTASLGGGSTGQCRDRQRASSSPLVTVPDLGGLTLSEALAKLQSLGLVAEPEGGDPASSPERQFTVYGQRTRAGSALAGGGTVAFTVHGAFTATTALPDVVGLPFDQAKARLEEAGFTVARQEIGRAPSPKEAFTVSGQDPGPAGEVRSGQQIVLKVYTRFDDPQCGRALAQAQDADRGARAGEALQRYREARQLGCQAPGLDSAIARIEQWIQQQARQAEGARQAEQTRQAEQARQAEEAHRAEQARRTEEARQAREAQQARQCDALIQQGNAAGQAGRSPEAIGAYSQARQLGCNAAGLDNAIAGLERRIQAQQAQQREAQQVRQCDALMQQGNAASQAGRSPEAIGAYSQARRLGCNIAGLDNAITRLEQRVQQQNQQAQQCDGLIQRGNTARNRGQLPDALNAYHQARQLRCNVQGLDGAIAGLERQIRQDQQCQGLIQQGNSANSSGQVQGALNAYVQARGAGCGSPQLDSAIAQLENQLRRSPAGSGGGTARPGSGRAPTGSGGSGVSTIECPPGQVWAPGGLLGMGPEGSCVVPRR